MILIVHQRSIDCEKRVEMYINNWIMLFIELFGVGVVVFIAMKQYISFKRTPFYAMFTAFLGWYLCFNIVFLVPLDITATIHGECLVKANDTCTINNTTSCEINNMCPEPISYLPDVIVVNQWRILYWGTFVLSWLIFPILQTFSGTGDFRIRERLLRAIKENIILYCFMGIVGLITLIIILAMRLQALATLVQSTFIVLNVYGLVLVVVTMGFGLVDVPRNLLRKGDYYRTLRHYRVHALELKNELDESTKKLEHHLRLIKQTSDRAGEYHPYRPYLDIIISKCPLEFDQVDTEDMSEASDEITYSKVVEMHANLMDFTHQAERADTSYKRLLGKAFATEDIIATLEKPSDLRSGKIEWSFKQTSSNPTKARWEYYWHLYIYPNFYKALGALGAIMSLLIVWAEISMAFSSSNLANVKSPFAMIIRSTDASMNGLGLQIFCFIPLILVPQQQTNSLSIMFSSNYLGRLAAPLSYNFLQICGLTGSNFNSAMGDMNAFALNNFNKYFPFIVVFVCLIPLFQIHTRLASMCCIKSMRVTTDNSEAAAELGSKILKEVRENQVEGVPPPKTRMSIIKDIITGKKSKSGSGSPKDGASQEVKRPTYKPPSSNRSTVMMGLSRDYTSKSGTTFKSTKSENNAILTIDNNNNSGSSSYKSINNDPLIPKSNSNARLESKGINYWDKLNFKYNQDDSDDDIEMGKF
ncbi:hypothetical protein PPL_03485 [Heterostelium album PN500]|uniref:Uncharacterized protein n=1 Tax=Heterostelium pallidum (strain ATCC 26659 / Pp 5 / PN500) TaxID=670386 RepID=D3B509_HETP5|nr:hypothetical protein PPL_03485 [Heterostelium album PN500]EFA84407.1 hypothetical protein PPL_03485 [Heterostelium album PN500]|eukprot:XP_020436521.1 hypothetical protein PPL_03485 [Heterostelium album PN500]